MASRAACLKNARQGRVVPSIKLRLAEFSCAAWNAHLAFGAGPLAEAFGGLGEDAANETVRASMDGRERSHQSGDCWRRYGRVGLSRQAPSVVAQAPSRTRGARAGLSEKSFVYSLRIRMSVGLLSFVLQ